MAANKSINWKQALVKPHQSIREAIRIIDEIGLQIAVVADENGLLMGTVTDGDIRRGVLRDISLDSPVTEVMKSDCIMASQETSQADILGLMKKHSIRQVPVVDAERRVIRIEAKDEIVEASASKNTVIIMAGGLGQRLKPLTDNCPKPLLKIGDKPILEWIVEGFREQGFSNFHFAVNYRADMIENYFEDGKKWNVDIEYLHEDQRLGTAGAIGLLKKAPEDSMIVMNGDLLTNVNFKNLLDYHKKLDAVATMCVRQFNFQIPYGVVDVDGDSIVEVHEKPVESYFVNSGIYALKPEVMELIPKNEYFDMTDLFHKLKGMQKKVSPFPLREYWLDIGRSSDYQLAQNEVEKFQR